MKNMIIITSMLTLSLAAGQALANKPPRDGKPPQEAYDACLDKSEGDAVTIETPHGHQLEATCELKDEQLVAVPKRHRKHGDRD